MNRFLFAKNKHIQFHPIEQFKNYIAQRYIFFNGTLLFIYSEMFNKFTAQTEHLGKKNVTETIAVLKENF